MAALLNETVPQEKAPVRYVQVRMSEDDYEQLRQVTFDTRTTFQEFALSAIKSKLDEATGGQSAQE